MQNNYSYTGMLGKFSILCPAADGDERFAFGNYSSSSIALRQQQYEYYRDLLFSFPKPDEAVA